MKSVLSTALVICLVSSAFPVVAQERTEAVASLEIRELMTPPKAFTPDALRHAVEGSELGQPRSPHFARTVPSVAKGALIGFGIGALLGATIGQEACLNSPRWHCAVGAGAMFAAIGAGIAWLRK